MNRRAAFNVSTDGSILNSDYKQKASANWKVPGQCVVDYSFLNLKEKPSIFITVYNHVCSACIKSSNEKTCLINFYLDAEAESGVEQYGYKPLTTTEFSIQISGLENVN